MKNKKTFWATMIAIGMIVALVLSILAWTQDKPKDASDIKDEE